MDFIPQRDVTHLQIRTINEKAGDTMATETEEKEQTTPEPTPEPIVAENTVEPEQPPQKTPPPPKKRELLLTVLTILFVLVGIAELGLWTITGFGVFRTSQARRAYEAQQAGLQTGNSQPLGFNYSGPGLIIENGEIVWQRVDDLTPNTAISGQDSVQGTGVVGNNPAVDPTLYVPYPPPPWGYPVVSDRAESEPSTPT